MNKCYFLVILLLINVFSKNASEIEGLTRKFKNSIVEIKNGEKTFSLLATQEMHYKYVF